MLNNNKMQKIYFTDPTLVHSQRSLKDKYISSSFQMIYRINAKQEYIKTS